MKGKLLHIKDLKFLGVCENHSIVFDDGKDALTPMQCLLLSLASCTAMDVWHIMKKKRQPLVNMEVNIEAEREENYPKVFKRIKIEYIFEGDVESKACEQAIELSMKKYCSISNMLKSEIETSFEII